MLSSELLIDTAARVDQWVVAHLDVIVAAMKKAHINKVTEQMRDYSGISPNLEIWGRTYSEMPICDVWRHLDPPTGFEIIPWEIGRVKTIGPTTKLAIYTDNHSYAQNSAGVILCITPGQFEAIARTDLYAGDRLQRLKDKAPELMSLYPDDRNKLGIGILFGPREEIAQKLNFVYTTVS